MLSGSAVPANDVERLVRDALLNVEKRCTDIPTKNTKWTRQIKDELQRAAESINAQTCDTGCQKPEWLYDVCWLKHGPADELAEVMLVVESEWKRDKHSFWRDFRKLIIARATLRVMIMETTDESQTKRYLGDFVRIIN